MALRFEKIGQTGFLARFLRGGKSLLGKTKPHGRPVLPEFKGGPHGAAGMFAPPAGVPADISNQALLANSLWNPAPNPLQNPAFRSFRPEWYGGARPR